ncbi:GNAT family N-acetyltransferase [Vibrio sonorensis]|uniref:GNAT family N-acetyltransferase n=1 Tax=Vibrio sonorensis TaxID=1004316 RepID=UPI0008DA9941|nr:N-acetyltransferase [Vibrio sonorensis]
MLLRTEAPADILVIDQLVKSAFETEAEAELVMRLRENGNLTLSLVACTDEGEVIGHVMFSPVTLNGEETSWQGLAPLAVKEEYRNKGIGQKLIEEGFASLREFGYPVCVVVGDPAYYGRFGFESASAYQLDTKWSLPEGIFQVVDLTGANLDGVKGRIGYCPEFDQL